MSNSREWNAAVLAARSAIGLSLLLFAVSIASAQAPTIIDTHGHLLAGKARYQGGGRPSMNAHGALDVALERMDQAGIRRTIIIPPPMVEGTAGLYDIESYDFARKSYAGRILIGGGGGSLNVILQSTAPDEVTDEIRKAFRQRAEEIVSAGAVVFGEISLHHLSLRPMGTQHPYEWTPPDHPLLLLLADIAAERNIPMDLHLDLVPEDMSLPNRPVFNATNPALLKANRAAFERLLAHNRRARIVWAHAGTDFLGTRTPGIQRELLSRNPNLFMSLRLNAGRPAPFFALDADKKLKPSWLALLRDFPDRFVIGTDAFHRSESGARHGPDDEALQNYRAALAQMPPELANAVAHGNAERIYPLDHR